MTDFETKLTKISPSERRILQLLSLFWEQITATEFLKLLRIFHLKTSEGRAFSAQYVSLLRNSLVHKGALENTVELWGSGFQIESDELKEFLTREVRNESWFDAAIATVQENFTLSEFSSWYQNGERLKSRLLRDYRLSLYRRDKLEMMKLLDSIRGRNLEPAAHAIRFNVFANPFQSEFLAGFDRRFQNEVLLDLFADAFESGTQTDLFWNFIRENSVETEPFQVFTVLESILKGDIAEAEKSNADPKNLHALLSAMLIAALKQEYETATILGEEAVKFWRKWYGKKKGFPADWRMFFFALALFKTNEAKFHQFADEHSRYALKNYPDSIIYRAVNALAHFLKNNDQLAVGAASQMRAETFLEKFIRIIVTALVPPLSLPNYVRDFEKQAHARGFAWCELEAANLLSIRGASNLEAKKTTETLRARLGIEPLGNLVPKLEDWERALNTLLVVAENAQGGGAAKSAAIDETRVAWLLDFEKKEIQPVEQKFGKKGWTDGRNIALKRLYERDVKNLTEQDALVVKTAMKRFSDYSYYGSYEYDFDWQKSAAALVGHPFLFLMKNPSVNVQLEAGEPSLLIRQKGETLELSFDTPFADEGVIVRKETETRYKVVEITKNHVDIAGSLPANKLQIPAQGREKLLRAIQPLSAKISIQSDLEEHFENLPFAAPETRIHALITPIGDGFHLEFFVKPFGAIPPYFKPGKGVESVIADVEGVRTRTKRDLKKERRLLNEVEEACPFLAEFESENYEWELSGAEECLTAMSELETPREAGKLVVEWTKGQKLKLLGSVNFSNFSMSVKGAGNWFEVDGKVRVNENLVLSVKELTDLLPAENKNFIELSDGQFIAITEKLRKHLQSLTAVMDDKNRLHNLRSGILEEFSEDLENFKADKAWKEHLAKIKEANKFVPELPKTFDAELRPYQIEGYEWLSRLAHWGVGACLADDMGLGKTLMSLGLLVERAERGAALVVAPVSVTRNWLKEAQKFAPTLNVQLFGDGDRQSQIKSAGKYDVLVTSYNLLQIEEEHFTSRNFATVILDEAQAVKNRATKRSKTVMNLNGDFRLITTGTPVENHLGELWNLFNFINPGLLGSHDFFNEKFALPIEKNKDETARKTLQKLIQPFTLRRRKNQVLDDLPAKTEIMLTVEMSEPERAFYESVRRDALDKIESQDGDAKDKRFRILAELTRLRLACCHPKLVNENVTFGSSKLELFGETLDELLENKHKALVFSQFVKHLRIIEEYLQSKQIKYHYLDGGTPAHVRQERIDAFQRGDADVFLISLKAGGTGLNLTAADYVIHLDPWWNPAVEDQATDRVHRIGQQRPVTVYRLVTEDTVEEKILKLHETKRDLADSLLDGSDTSAKLSADDLLALISEI